RELVLGLGVCHCAYPRDGRLLLSAVPQREMENHARDRGGGGGLRLAFSARSDPSSGSLRALNVNGRARSAFPLFRGRSIFSGNTAFNCCPQVADNESQRLRRGRKPLV